MKKTTLILAILLVGPALFADGLSRQYKKWDRTPEAYFLTRAERAQWKNVRTDAEAQNFILDYKAKRGPEWQKAVNERIAAADKYFSAGETKGSETLRGKIIILFGPPSAIDQSGGKGKGGANEGAAPALQSLGGGGGKGGGGGDESVAMSSGGASPMGTSPRHADSPSMTFVYDEPAAPKAIGKPFKIEVKMISSSYQETWDPKGLDEKFETIAEASILPNASRDSK
jgi:GWxTD domain-containing protein